VRPKILDVSQVAENGQGKVKGNDRAERGKGTERFIAQSPDLADGDKGDYGQSSHQEKRDGKAL
jgi:hypothetical protein